MKWIDVKEPTKKRNVKKAVYEVAQLPQTEIDSNQFLKAENTKEIKKRILQVIEVEAPITEWLLIKRVINSFGIWKAGTNIRTKMFSILDTMHLNDMEDYDMHIYWRNDQIPKKYYTFRLFGDEEEACRDIINVPTIEISNAIYFILNEEGPMDYETLTRTTAAMLGYTRMGSNVVSQMKRGVKQAVKRFHLDEYGGTYSIMQ